MNAWTGPDFTAYPFSTKNQKDFLNLMRVYMDAAFKPNLDKRDFMQEGWRWEIDEQENLDINGIVFNEMKGAFESQGSFFSEQTFKNLFQGSEYGNCHGGEPEDIMDLTYQAFKDFHTQNYHPSNCTLVTYGDMSPEQYVDILESEYLNWFDAKSFSIIPTAPDVIKNKKINISGPSNMDSVKPGYDGQFSLNFLCRDLQYKKDQSPEELLDYRGLQILKTLLFDFPKSPFYKNFLETGIAGGFTSMTGFDENVYYPYFSFGFRDVKNTPSDLVELKENIMKTLSETADKGFDKAMVNSVLNMVEMNCKDQKVNFGIELSESLIGFFNYQNIKGISNLLDISENMKELRNKIENDNFLGELIKKYFLQNSEVVELSLTPDKNFSLKTETAIRDKILSKQKTLTLQDTQQIKKDNDALQEYQESIQNLEVLPKLEVSDIVAEIPRTSYSIESVKKVPTMFVEDHFNGLSHFRLVLDISDLSESLLPYINMLELFFGQLGTKTLKYDDFNESLSQVADQISVYTTKTLHPSNSDQFIHTLNFKVSCLDRNIDKTLRLLTDLLTQPDFEDKARLSQLIQMTASDLSGSLVENAISHALSASGLGFDYLGSRSNSYTQTQFMLNFAKNCLKTNHLTMMLEDLAFHFDFVLKKIFQKGKLKLVVHSKQENKKNIGRELKKMLTSMEQVYHSMKSEDKTRASKSTAFFF